MANRVISYPLRTNRVVREICTRCGCETKYCECGLDVVSGTAGKSMWPRAGLLDDGGAHAHPVLDV